ncbi:flagellin, partial [Rhizobiaceae sp. 2RAB30]
SKVQSEITQLQQQLTSIASSASFSGENWLSVNSADPTFTATKEIVASFTRAADGSVGVGTLVIDVASSKLFDSNDQSGILDNEDTTTNGGVAYSVSTLDISALSNSANDLADLDQMISWVDTALKSMTTSASDLGAAKTRINLQTDFVSNLMDAIDRGVGTLVDADMNEESTRLQALQVQQQLGIQALSIANGNSQQILSLFR